MSERLKFEGRLAERERDLRAMKLKAEGLVNGIRETLDPFEEIESLNADIAAEQAIELAALVTDYKECQAEISALKKALGR